MGIIRLLSEFKGKLGITAEQCEGHSDYGRGNIQGREGSGRRSDQYGMNAEINLNSGARS